MKQWFVFLLFCLASWLSYANPLPAEEVFQISAKRIDPNTFAVNWEIKPGYFLYSERIKLIPPTQSGIHLGIAYFPITSQKTDPKGRSYPVYRNQVELPVAVLGEHPGETLITVQFQGCADTGFCYPPETRQIKLTISKDLTLSNASLEAISPSPVNQQPVNDIEALFVNNHWIMVILSFFGFGLLLSFTPCVLPMIPVLSGIIVGHSKNLSTRKAFFLSLSYVLSMSFTYALAGAAIAQLGSNFQVAMQIPWVIGLFSLLFVLLALSMFGFYELRLPTSWQAKLANATRHQASGHYMSAAIMGSLSILILSPCVTAPLIGALGYIAHSNSIILGASALFFLSLGMGTPLLLIGTSAGKWLPKAGKWMNAVKAFFGVMLLAIAIYLLERILPGPFVMGLWASLLIFSGLYCGALTYAASNLDKLRQGLGLILLSYGILDLIGASMGSSNPLQPLTGFQSVANSASTLPVQTIKTVDHLEKAFANAKGKPVMLDFYADWCTSCKVMEKTTFKDPRVEKALKKFVVLKVDITANNAQEKALLNQFNVIAPPTFLFFNKEGNEQSHLRMVGETSANEFLKQLNLVLGLDKTDGKAL
ncbi:protein-disulfide reductase DsbD [Legionella fairfieldensis]|uniref:protein-disulfide reductase DsbD n=1 Tax=Legionella fairfieldensis TaxID=45064 RepID=UPI0004916054|nr:protein-disulfide reductase DsbD [Legionella fairfieldensis]